MPEAPFERGFVAERGPVETMDSEIVVALTGIDGTSGQTLHTRHRYLPEDVRFGMRFADMLSPLPGGRIKLDYARFHELLPVDYPGKP